MGSGMSGILANAAGGGGLLAGLFSGGAAPLVGIAGQFLQGIFNRNAANRERQQSIEDVRQQFVRLREAAELGGYNPLAVLGMGSGIPASRSGAYMGSAIADSALMMADTMQRNGEASRASRVSALEMANADLQERLTRATLRPTVGGVYQRPAVLSHPMAGGGNASSGGLALGASNAAGPAGRPLLDVSPLDPRREVQHQPVKTHSGFITIDNPDLPIPINVPTMDGEEPLHWYDLPDLALWGTTSWLQHMNTPEQRRLRRLTYLNRGAFGRGGAGHPLDGYRAAMMGRWSGVYTPDIVERFPHWGLFQGGAKLSGR